MTTVVRNGGSYGLPMAVAFELWGQRGYPHADIVGESHYEPAIRSLLGADFKPHGTELTLPAVLMPESGNLHDRHAIGVWVGGHLVGHLARGDAVRYYPVLVVLLTGGWAPQVNARVWGAEWDDNDGRGVAFRGSVRLDLADPHMIVPANLPPSEGHRLLPSGHAIQVTGENKHLSDLTPYLRPEGECWVHATLHEIVERSARTTRSLVEVRLDGMRVGQLTPKMSGELLPAVQHLAAQGLTTAVRAIVKGNRIKTEVVLYVVRAHELPDSWLGVAPAAAPAAAIASAAVPAAAIASAAVPAAATASAAAPAPVIEERYEHGPIPPRPTGVRFAVPPGWPTPPEGWAPPAGWRPDPTWKPAPEDWQWWELVWE